MPAFVFRAWPGERAAPMIYLSIVDCIFGTLTIESDGYR